MNTKKEILNFLKNHGLTVLSYIGGEGAPQSAVVEYMVTDDLQILFNTFTDKRKYKRILKNKSVSLVVGWDWDENITVQYEGQARELKGLELIKFSKFYFKHLSSAEQFANSFKHLGKLAFFKVEPSWIRYSGFNQEPWKLHELKY